MKQNLENIRRRIADAATACGRDPQTVRLVAVTKTVSVDRVAEAIDAGIDIVGENYIQEARDKFDALYDRPLTWHFIGHLQSNKAKYAVRMFDLIHSVDSLKLARALDKAAQNNAKIQKILIQVNISQEESKSGTTENEAMDLVTDISRLEHVRIKGLMTMPPFFDQPERARPFFHQLARLQRRIADRNIPGVRMDELSMGMTGDFEVAIQEGATLVRIGTALFGARR
ncbi:YggS family pyridoxal phosphate enzyme [Desulfosarcina ovata subsp. sediminis]|uniref:Pyridoxal phosphate homeostasis protein n=1 Tax=Desulfosarcina ovata subsp. sediminis TaxID=885957 RepID=A0A5K7ZIB1_9BACT|nr:YggS family pyridoxal phosphate-dependent enzyme [Desulfosarcina ovata]BBO79697.1 YggS family pyridoxal phosphate enzyme [Desulfosarcina ovata subsp. sediminis]